MSVIGTLESGERVIEAAVPAAWWVRPAIYLIGALIALGAAWFVVDRLFFAPGRAHAAAETAKVNTKVASTQVATGKDALATTQQVQVVHDRIEKITEINHDRILSAPGASGALPPAVDAAWLASVCLRDVYSASPSCVGLRGAATAVSDRPDAGGANPR